MQTKQQVVLTRIPGTRAYGQIDEDHPGGHLAPYVELADVARKDMGDPDRITVTVEPGDLLTP